MTEEEKNYRLIDNCTEEILSPNYQENYDEKVKKDEHLNNNYKQNDKLVNSDSTLNTFGGIAVFVVVILIIAIIVLLLYFSRMVYEKSPLKFMVMLSIIGFITYIFLKKH